MNRAFIFPGQGSQAVGMGKDFFDSFSESKLIFQSVDDALKIKLSEIIFSGPFEKLTLTENTQPAIMATSMAILSAILKQSNKKITELCSYVAGHSLGEYSALCAAESLSLNESAKLLHIRGSSMQKASKPGEGAMAACIGITATDLQDIIDHLNDDGICQIANDNVEGQIVISGHDYMIDRMIAILKDISIKVVKLKVSAPFHSNLIKEAEIPMKQALCSSIIKPPLVHFIQNVTADIVEDPSEIKQNLVYQICGRVRWRETMDKLTAIGVTELVEIGPGSVLTGLARKSSHNFKTFNISNVKEMQEFLELL
jgi:[acyl-carrier-protein] S-malonyltransferase